MRMPNVEKLSYVELLELQADIEHALKQRKKEAQTELREKMEQLAAEAGFSLEEVVSRPRVKKTSGKVAAKYRNPNDPTQTWAGRGRLPLWLVAELKRGRKLENFEVG